MDQSTRYMPISLITVVTLYQLLLFMVNPITPKGKKLGLNSNNIKPLLIQISYICIGDFKQILSHEDKFSFNNGNIVGPKLFQQTLSDLELYELEAKGQRFTWMNKREDEAFVMERLDKAFASIEWINSYPDCALKIQPILRFDHGSITLDFEMQQPFKRRPFRFKRM